MFCGTQFTLEYHSHTQRSEFSEKR